jgi:hypothetical protein
VDQLQEKQLQYQKMLQELQIEIDEAKMIATSSESRPLNAASTSTRVHELQDYREYQNDGDSNIVRKRAEPTPPHNNVGFDYKGIDYDTFYDNYSSSSTGNFGPSIATTSAADYPASSSGYSSFSAPGNRPPSTHANYVQSANTPTKATATSFSSSATPFGAVRSPQKSYPSTTTNKTSSPKTYASTSSATAGQGRNEGMPPPRDMPKSVSVSDWNSPARATFNRSTTARNGYSGGDGESSLRETVDLSGMTFTVREIVVLAVLIFKLN